MTLENDVYVYIPWSVSSESGWDKLNIDIADNNYVNYVSGEKSETINATLSAGTHTLTATYSKDGSTYRNEDIGELTFIE